MKRILVQYERLRRHYEHAEKTYDYASFLDLSHILRVWTELKAVLPKIEKSSASKSLFKSAVPNRKILRAHSKLEYIVAFMPDGTITHASNGNMLSGKDNKKDFSMGVAFSQLNDGPLTLYGVYFCSPLPSHGTKELISNSKVSRLNFTQWLGAEIVRINFKKDDGTFEVISIPREIFIKRLANCLDASHTSLKSSESFDNKFDKPIMYLMNFNCAGCPLPYYLLLKVAQDIVKYGPKLMGSENI